MTLKQRKPRTRKPQRTATELLNDPAIATVSLAQASLILGVGRTTAHNTFKRTGFVTDGVPAIRVGNALLSLLLICVMRSVYLSRCKPLANKTKCRRR